MKDPKYFIVVKDGSIYVVKYIKHKDKYYLWPYNREINAIVPRGDGYGVVPPGLLWTILSKYVVCTAVSKNEALSYATFKYISKHYPEALI